MDDQDLTALNAMAQPGALVFKRKPKAVPVDGDDAGDDAATAAAGLQKAPGKTYQKAAPREYNTNNTDWLGDGQQDGGFKAVQVGDPIETQHIMITPKGVGAPLSPDVDVRSLPHHPLQPLEQRVNERLKTYRRR